MISSKERIKLKEFLPYRYTIAVLKICKEMKCSMPKGGEITAQDIRNTLNGREHLCIEDAIYTVVEINQKENERLQKKRDKILNYEKK